MSVASRIEELLEKAAPLRALDPDDTAAAELPAIVDEINALRALQAQPGFVDSETADIPKKRGRPPKGVIEGADA